MTSRQLSTDSEDVRRSLDVLDRVLSEFDDIDPSSGDERRSESLPETQNGDAEKRDGPLSPSISEESPPPIDRSLKPKISPPMLPKKSRRSSSPPVDQKINESHLESYAESHSSHSNTQSSKKSSSDVSSHEYQEINSDLLGPVRKNSNQRPSREDRSDVGSRMIHSRHRSQEPPLTSGTPHFREGGVNFSSPSCGQLRKSRSGEVSLNDDMRGRKHGRRQGPRRSRSSDRLLDPRVISPVFPLPPLGPHFDPRMINPSMVDPRLIGPRFYDPRMADPRLLNARLPFHPKEFLPMANPKYIPDPHFPLEGSRHAFDDSVHFPHLLNIHHPPAGGQIPQKPLHPTHPMGALDYPLNIPPYDFPFMQDPTLLPEQLAALNFPLAMDSHLEGYDPRILGYIPEYPMDMPMNYGHDLPMEYPPRERLEYGMRGGPRNWESRILDGPPVSQNWRPPSADEARKSIERIVRSQNMCSAEEDAISGATDLRNESGLQQRYSKRPLQKGQHISIGHSDSSGRSSPIEDLSMKPQRIGQRSRHEVHEESMVHGGRGYFSGTVPGTKPPGSFRVGGAVRGSADNLRVSPVKEVMSLPHFASGGKDSGFDEGPLPEDLAAIKGVRTNNAPGGGGGFIVSGVFNDSSKMYIPCPPSPTPDYDEELEDTDDAESDILQGDLYTITEQQKNESRKEAVKPTISNASVGSKGTNSSNRDSISEDSLHDGKPSAKKLKSLETMMNEFHLGLPPPNHEIEGSYSDDSLEESSLASPSGPSTMDLRSQRPQSMESLVSMDGSTTSFDYMSGGASKSLSPGKSKAKKKIFQELKKNEIIKKAHPLLSHTNINDRIQDISNSNYIPESINVAPIPPPISFDITFPSTNSKVKKKSKKMETKIYGIHGQDNSKQGENTQSGAKFDTIRNMIKDGLIEGLDDNPPDFKPPPASEKPLNSTSSEERTDSGMGSTLSTNRTDESCGSDNHSDKSGTPPSSKLPFTISSPLCDRNDNSNIDSSNNNPCFNKNSRERHHHSPPPPPPPPRDSSMKGTPASTQPLPRNHSWLHKTKRPAPLPMQSEKMSPSQRVPEPVTGSRAHRISRVDDNPYLSGGNNLSQNLYPRGVENRLPNGYLTPQDYNRRISSDKDKQENLKNLESSRNRPDTLPVISEDQCSVSSHGSRSSRFFSRLSDSMKSGTRSSTTSSKGGNKNTSKYNAPSRPSPRVYGDIIRNPNKNITRPVNSHPDLPSVVSPSTIVPFTRDDSGRFRSIEDLAEESSVNKGNSSHPGGRDSVLEQKKKKHATLPPNLNSGSVEDEMKDDMRRATSLLYGKRHKEENESSKFKFNIFKGFWRRNKYSFDKT